MNMPRKTIEERIAELEEKMFIQKTRQKLRDASVLVFSGRFDEAADLVNTVLTMLAAKNSQGNV
jgi:hypothetical protein